MSTTLTVLEVALAAIKMAAASSDNKMIDKGVDIAEGIVGALKTGAEVDDDIAARVREFAAEVEADSDVNREDFEARAAGVRNAIDRWNNAG